MALGAATSNSIGTWKWFRAGDEVFPEMLRAIEVAERTVDLESYIFAGDALGQRFRDALVRARGRGLRVRVLIDALGSLTLSNSFWQPLRDLGGEVRLFNPLSLKRLGIRNHRKLLVCDDQVAFFGGFNIASVFEGDGIVRGWRDLGLRIAGPLPPRLGATFNEMFDRADFQHKRFLRLRRSRVSKAVSSPGAHLLLSGPGRGNPITRALRRDLAGARQVDIIVAYFLPTWRLRRDLVRIAKNGGRVRLILPGKSDVLLSLLAGQSLYRRALKAGIEIYEYQPQVLHAKLILIDDIVYVGSANLDHRSLNINYELMVRFASPEMAAQAKDIFEHTLQHCRQLTRDQWRRSRTLWSRLKQHWAYWVLIRIDAYIAQRQWRALPD